MASDLRTTPDLVAVQQLVAVPAVLATMRSSGLLDRLIDGAPTIDELATDLGFDPDGLERLCVTLERLGVIHREDGRWSTTLTRELIASTEDIWASLDPVLAGRPRRLRSDDADAAAASYPQIVGRLTELYGASADRLVEHVPVVGGRILDIGAGAASWSIAMLRAWPDARATMLDLPGVADVTRKAVADAGVADRAVVVTGDVWKVDLDAGFDLVLLAGVCHLFDDDRVIALLARAVQWLAPGGRLVVIDGAGRYEPTSLDGAIHDLSLWLRSGGGHRSESTHLRWLVDAGLTGAHAIDLEDAHLGAVTATLEDCP